MPINKFRDMSDALLAKAKLKESEAEDADEGKEPEPTAEQQTIALLTESATNWPKPNQNSHPRCRGYRRADWAPAIACS